jgi:hypothetical protein
MMRRSASVALAVLATLGLLAVSCSDEEPPAPTTTTGTALPPRTTLPPVVTTAPTASTTTTVPAEIATAVDACALVEPQELRAVAGEEPGPGTPLAGTDPPGRVGSDPSAGMLGRSPDAEAGPDEPDRPATLLLAGCTWPTDGAPLVTLTYLAPTTAGSGLDHLQRLVDLDTRFARGARIFPLPGGDDLGPAALVDESGSVIEIAVVTGSALLYVVPRDPPPSGTPEADALVRLLLAAAGRAPG